MEVNDGILMICSALIILLNSGDPIAPFPEDSLFSSHRRREEAPLVSGWLPTWLRTKDAFPPSRNSLTCPFGNPRTSRSASLLRARGPGAVVSAPTS